LASICGYGTATKKQRHQQQQNQYLPCKPHVYLPLVVAAAQTFTGHQELRLLLLRADFRGRGTTSIWGVLPTRGGATARNMFAGPLGNTNSRKPLHGGNKNSVKEFKYF